MKAVFRADASATIGAGHVMRCLALAGQMRMLGWKCVFTGTAETIEFPGLRSSGFDVLALPDRDGAGALAAALPNYINR